MLWGKATSDAIRSMSSTSLVLLPIGSTEQHGPHLPVETDTYIVERVAAAVAQRVPNVLVAPALPYGYSRAHDAYAGTVTVSPKVYLDLLQDLCLAFRRSGFATVFLLSGHSGNGPFVDVVTKELSSENFRIYGANYFGFCQQPFSRMRRSPLGGEMHSGELETSLMLHLAPEAVNTTMMSSTLTHGTEETGLDLYAAKRVYAPPDYVRTSANGVKGDPTVATAELGRILFEETVQNLSRYIQEVLLSRPEGT